MHPWITDLDDLAGVSDCDVQPGILFPPTIELGHFSEIQPRHVAPDLISQTRSIPSTSLRCHLGPLHCAIPTSISCRLGTFPQSSNSRKFRQGISSMPSIGACDT